MIVHLCENMRGTCKKIFATAGMEPPGVQAAARFGSVGIILEWMNRTTSDSRRQTT